MRRSIISSLSALVALAGTCAAMPTAQASESYAVAISGVDAGRAGHVTGTVTTDAPGVVIWSKDDDNAGGVDWLVVRNHPGGAIDFDLSTWGIESGTVRVFTCTADAGTCDAGQDLATFTATDVAPVSVTWPTDTTIGEEPYAVSVTDAATGGGTLWVSTATGPTEHYGLPGGSAPVARSGASTVVPLWKDGVQTLYLLRCDTLETPRACRPTGLSTTIDLDREIHILTATGTPYAGTSATFTLTLDGDHDHPEATGPVDVDWQLIGPSHTIDASGTATGLAVTDHDVKVDIPTASLPQDEYSVRWTVHATNEAFGTVTGYPQEIGTFIVDHTPPPPVAGFTASATTVYPAADGYRDAITFRSSPGYVDGTARVEIWNSTGTTRLQSIPWDSRAEGDFVYTWSGRRTDGTPYAADSYKTRVVYRDPAGNTSALWGPPVTVVRKHLSTRDWTRTVTAKDSLAAGHAGGCSRLRSPSGHGWSGSLGLLSRYYCSGTGASSLVKTVHQATAPAGVRYGLVSLAVYGGSARGRVTDSLTVNTSHDGQWYQHAASATVGWHSGVGTMEVGPGRLLSWESWADRGHRYDVASYRLHMRYQILIAD